jgi:hypothetical protein
LRFFFSWRLHGMAEDLDLEAGIGIEVETALLASKVNGVEN